MFAHEIILAKTGPLARIWLAAHWDKKLKKKDIFETKLVESVENIINPKMKLALRTSGHLLLGVVKIYSRKTGFLYTDCNEAIVKLRSAFRPGAIEATTKESNKRTKAAPILLTADLDLPDIDTPIPDLNDLDLDKNRARLEEITLREENDFLNVDDLEISGDQAYNSELAIDLDNEEMMRNLNEVFGDNQMDTFTSENLMDDDCLKTETGYDDEQEMSAKVGPEDTAENPDKLIDDLQNPMSQAPPSVRSEYEAPESPGGYEAPESPGPMSPMMPPSTPGSVRPPRPDTANSIMSEGGTPTPIAFGNIQRSETPMSQRSHTPQPMPEAPPTPIYQEPPSPHPVPPPPIHHQPLPNQMSTNQMMNSLHQKAPQAPTNGRMNLRERKEPMNHPSYMEQEQPSQAQPRRRRVRRQLIIDQQIGIDAETMRAQLRDHSDIVGTLVMAPPVEKLLRSKEESNPEKLFNTPIGRIHSGLHATCFTANCRTDLPKSALLRQEQANVSSFTGEAERRQQHSYNIQNTHHDSDDEDMYNYGPPSVASSYAQDEQQMSKVDNHEQDRDNAWARATGQTSYEQNLSMQTPVATTPRADTSFSESMVEQQPPTPAPPTPQFEAHDSPAPLSPPAPDSPLPQQEVPPSPAAPPTPQPTEMDSYEPEPKRLRTASAEQELKDVEAGKGTAACIKYTQRLLTENVDVSFNQMAVNDTRKLAAQKFYSLLVMLKHEQITAVQTEPYADIVINKGINFGGVISDHC